LFLMCHIQPLVAQVAQLHQLHMPELFSYYEKGE
jgi:hypothetical protein